MATTEGIGAAIAVDPQIEAQLKKIQGTIDKMAKSAENLANGFTTFASGANSLMNSISKNGLSVVVKNMQAVANAASNLGQTQQRVGKTSVQTEQALNDRLKDILGKRAATYREITSVIKSLQKYQADFKASNAASGNTFNDAGFKQSAKIIADLTNRVKDLGLQYDKTAAKSAVLAAKRAGQYGSTMYTDYDGALKAINKVNLALSELYKPGGDSMNNAKQNTSWIHQMETLLAKIQGDLPRLKTELANTKKAATSAASELNKALNAKTSGTSTSLEDKINRIYNALARVQALRAGGNKFVNPADIAKGTAALQTLQGELTKVQQTEMAAANSMRQMLTDNVAFTNNPKQLVAQYEQLMQLFKQMSAVSKKNAFLNPADIKLAADAVAAFKQKLGTVNTSMNTLGKNAMLVSSLMSMVFNPFMIVSFLKNMVAVRGEFEMQQRSLEIIINDANMAKDMFSEIEQIAIKSPFSVQQILKQTKQLAAYRIESEKLIDTTKMLGDISAGLGVDMNRLILAYGQVKATTWLKATELRQFSEAGVNMLGGLADRFSEIYQRAVSTSEVMKMITKRMVSFEDVDAVLRKQTGVGGTFYKMQEKQAETLRGMIVNLKDRLQIAFNEMGTSYDGLMKKIVKGAENVISNWKTVSTVFTGFASFKILSGVFNIIGHSAKGTIDIFKKVTTALAANRAMFDVAARSGIAYSAMMKNMKNLGTIISTVGIGNVIAALSTIGIIFATILRHVTALKRDIARISENLTANIDERVSTYEKLLGIASDVNEKENTRQDALDRMKKEYGDLLSIQKVELDNINEITKAREQQVELIKLQAQEESKHEAISSLVKDLNRSAADRLSELMSEANGGGVEDFKEMFQDEVKGLKLIDEDDADAARKIIENKIIQGTITSADEANKEFFKLLLVRAGAVGNDIEDIMSRLGDNSFYKVTTAFERVLKKTQDMYGYFEDNGVDLSMPKTLQKYEDLITELKDAESSFNKSLSNSQKNAYKNNPQQKDLDLQAYIDNKKEEIFSAIEGDDEVGDELARMLNGKVEEAYRKVSLDPGSKWIKEQMAKVNEELGSELRIKIGAGDLRMTEKQDIGEYLASINEMSKGYQKEIDKIFSDTATIGEIMEVASIWAADAYNKYLNAVKNGNEEEIAARVNDMRVAAIHNIQMEQEAIIKVNELLGEEDKKQRDINAEMKARSTRQREIYEFAKKVIELTSKYDSMTDKEIEAFEDNLVEINPDVNILQPTDFNINSIKDWLSDFVYGELTPMMKLQLEIELNKASKTLFDDIENRVSSLGDQFINVGKKWKDMTDKEKELEKTLLQSQLTEMLGLSNIPDSLKNIELPEIFSYEGLTAWGETLRTALQSANADVFDEKFWAKWELKLIDLKKAQKAASDSSANEYKKNLKDFVADVKKAAKEFGTLNDEGDALLKEQLQRAAKKIGVTLPEAFTSDAINEWLKSYEKTLGRDNVLEIKLAWNKEDTADAVREMSEYASTLWDKYNNAKKMEEWGISFSGSSSADIMNEIKSVEDNLRKDTSDASQKSAEDIKKKRLEIIRSEQEDAAKLIYEGQKKASTKVEQIYQTMFENISKIRNKANGEGGGTVISEESINAGVKGQIAKAMKEVAEAEWDAYKNTEMYAMAFGDLEGLGVEVLERLRDQLEGFKNGNALAPTELIETINAIKDLDERIEQLKGSGFGGVIANGFKQISAAASEFKESMPGLMDNFMVTSDEVAAAQAWVDILKERLVLEPENAELKEQLKAANEQLRDAQNANAEAARNLTDAQKRAIAKMSSAKKNIQAVGKAYDDIKGFVDTAISAFDEFTDAFGIAVSPEAQAAIEGFQKGFNLVATSLSVVNAAMTMYNTLTEIEIGLTATLETLMWPLIAVAAALAATLAIVNARDASLESQIDEHKEAVENLEKAYEKLETAMEEALNTRKAASYHNQLMANLQAQRREIEEAIELEKKRKQTDEVVDATKDLQDQLDELDDDAKQLADDWMELMGATSDWSGLANDWASDWLDAFKNAESGLDSLKESFDDLWDSIVAKQLSNALEGYITDIKNYLESALADGVIDEAEAAMIASMKNQLASAHASLAEQVKKYGVTQTGEASEDTLQRGIESVSEQTAQALESILNSTRYYVADNNRILLAMEQSLLVGEGENTILSQMKSQTRYLKSISEIADSVYYPGSHSKGAGGIKVFVD